MSKRTNPASAANGAKGGRPQEYEARRQIAFTAEVWTWLQTESERTGKSYSQIVNERLTPPA